jgi:hypothetical protein
MKSPAKLVFLLAFGLTLTAWLPAAVVNDGNSINNLGRLSNTNQISIGNATVELTVDPNGFLTATQNDLSGDFALRNVWYAATSFATSGVYSASADFLPAEVLSGRQGGVMGWLNLATNKGIAFYLQPADPDPSFRVAVIDFNALDGEANENQTNLFKLDGTSALGALDSAWAALGTNYSATNFATFHLDFSTPTAAEMAAVSNATAHITAKVFQGVDASTNPIPVGQPIELLTDLPVPDAANHRFGYFAVWGSIVAFGGTIGYLDNLSASGASIPTEPPNPPGLVIMQNGANVEIRWPADYTSFILQATDSLNPTNWASVPAPGNLYSTLPAGTSRFFRLIK